MDTRKGPLIWSRVINFAVSADLLVDFGPKILPILIIPSDIDVVLVDECQFLAPKTVDALRLVALKKRVFCYGLLRGTNGVLFPGSARLIEVCDTLEEKKAICEKCGGEATMTHKRFETPKFIGGNEMYATLCYTCWWYFHGRFV